MHLAKVIFMLKHSVKLRRYILLGDVAAFRRAACVLCAVHRGDWMGLATCTDGCRNPRPHRDPDGHQSPYALPASKE